MMSLKYTVTIFLLILSPLAFSQTKKSSPVTNFHQFDLIKKNDSVRWAMTTNKIKFSKTHLDTIKSKPYLDSIDWFLKKHPYTRVEIFLSKDDTPSKPYGKTDAAQSQTKDLVEYLMKKGTDIQRLLHNGSCDCLRMKADDKPVVIPKKKNTGIIFTHIRILSEDFKDPNK
ncbi:MAG: hypothetical protein K0S32_2871 [Bacteroidetes bacterium]|jgi:hypothetical protein|nr:hypothetical protein [Bacteroidota bacterium]